MLPSRTPENRLAEMPHLLKLHRENVLNRQKLSGTLAACREIWRDDAAQDCGGCGVVNIHLQSNANLPPPPAAAPHLVRT